MRQETRIIGLLALAACLLLPTLAHADGGALVVVIRTGFDVETGEPIRKSRVVDAVTATLKVMSEKVNDDAVNQLAEKTTANHVKEITASDFNAYKRLVNPDSPLAPLPTQTTEELQLRQLPALIPTWEMTLLGAVPRQIDKLKLTFMNDAGETKPLELTPSLKPEDPLTMTQLGTYALRLDKGVFESLGKEEGVEPNWKVTEYEADVSTLDKKSKTVTGPWVQDDSYYLIRLDGIDQHRELFSSVIKDRSENGIGGVALDVFNVAENATLALGNAGVTAEGTGEDFVENKLGISIPALSKTNCARAWMLFPLTKEQAETELKALNVLSLGDVPKTIRSRNPVMAGTDAVVRPGDSATWFEVPRAGAGAPSNVPPSAFHRDIYLVDTNIANTKPEEYRKLLESYPNAHKIVVYEFENATGTVRNSPEYTVRGASGTKPKPHAANATEVKSWSSRLPELAKPTE